MPLAVFKGQGKICKSERKWREQALAQGWLVEYSSDLVCIFISHRWWHHPPNRPANAYDWGGPDYVEGNKANLKWKIICRGVDTLVEQHALDANKVALWIDWQARASSLENCPQPLSRLSCL